MSDDTSTAQEAALLAPCATCGFQPWNPKDPKCEATSCVQPATSWWHTKAGLHWLACDRHAQPKVRETERG